MNLNVPDYALTEAAGRFRGRAHDAASYLDELMLAVTSDAQSIAIAQRMVECRQWLYVLSDTLDEYRTSLVYADALLRSGGISHDNLIRRTGQARAIGYFLENAALRAFSVAEKAAQLINAYFSLGLKEKGEVSFQRVSRLVADKAPGDPVNKMSTALAKISQLRHAHAHRFDPGVVRSRLERVHISVGDSECEGRLWTMAERPVSFGEEHAAYSAAYLALDGALCGLFEAIGAAIRGEVEASDSR